MRVLHVIPAVAPRYGGPSHAIVAMCRKFMSIGFEPLIVSTDADGRGRLGVPLGTPCRWDGVSAVFFPRQWSEAYKYSHPLARWLRDHVALFPIVHIHGVFSHSCLVAGSLCRRGGVPYIVRPLGTLDPWSLSQKRVRKAVAWKLAARELIAGAAAVHYASERERERAESATGVANGRVIPPGLDIPEEARGAADRNPSESCPNVLFLSRLHPKKGLDLLIEAFLNLTAGGGFPGWRLVVAGSGEPRYERQLRRQVTKRGGNGRVRFVGWLDGDEKAKVLNRASLLALPSYQENLGFCLIEALARGVPVLVSDRIDLAGSIFRERAGWVSRVNREELTAQLAAAMRDEGERERRGLAGREWTRREFSWEVSARALAALYNEVAAGSP